MDVTSIIKNIWPLILIQFALQIYSLFDLFWIKKGKTENLNSGFWAIIIILTNILGPIFYFLIGRYKD